MVFDLWAFLHRRYYADCEIVEKLTELNFDDRSHSFISALAVLHFTTTTLSSTNRHAYRSRCSSQVSTSEQPWSISFEYTRTRIAHEAAREWSYRAQGKRGHQLHEQLLAS